MGKTGTPKSGPSRAFLICAGAVLTVVGGSGANAMWELDQLPPGVLPPLVKLTVTFMTIIIGLSGFVLLILGFGTKGRS